MIDPKELRIGNFIQVEDTVLPVTLEILSGLAKDDSDSIQHCSYHIPLTEEWLVKCSRQEGSYWVFDHSENDVLFRLGQIRICSDGGKTYEASGLFSVEISGTPPSSIHDDDIFAMTGLVIRYVHELKNLYVALTGKDLNFEE